MKNQEKRNLLTYVFMGIVIAVITSMLFSCSVQSNCCVGKRFKVNKAKTHSDNSEFLVKRYHGVIKRY